MTDTEYIGGIMPSDMRIIYKPIDELVPYKRNPRKNDEASEKLSKLIENRKFRIPILIDGKGTIIAGHTRLKALRRLNYEGTVACIMIEDMTEEEVRAFRLEDNRSQEWSEWDDIMLMEELEDIGIPAIGFNKDVDFGNLEGMMEDEIDEDHQAFLDKFKEKHTTDDCFTPPAVYDAVLDWVLRTYSIDKKRTVVRPFYPGGDYKTFAYPKNCIVIDNPPFSIHAEICRFYMEKGIDFFLFANGLTCLNGLREGKIKAVVANCQIVYENGADINTAFLTNLGDCDITVSGELHDAVEQAQPSETVDLKAYSFPDNLTTAAMLGRLAKYGANFTIEHVKMIDRLDDGTDIFGKGALISDVKAEKVKAEKVKIPVLLSERERGSGLKNSTNWTD